MISLVQVETLVLEYLAASLNLIDTTRQQFFSFKNNRKYVKFGKHNIQIVSYLQNSVNPRQRFKNK